jgi:hypothetical protein
MSNLYDPYRNAVRHTLQDKAHEKRKKIFLEKSNQEKAKKFLNKKIYLNDLINLPEGLASSLFLGLFITVPYLLGLLFIFIILAKASFHTYESIESSFAFSWVIGYEFLAVFLLLMILKSSLHFK